MARPRKTAAMMRADGNPSMLSRAELAEREAQEVVVAPAEPPPPEWLPPEAEGRFRLVARQLAQAKIVAELDADAIARYVMAQMKWEDLALRYAEAARRGDVEEMGPLARLEDVAFKAARAQGNDLGLSPTARLHVAGGGREPPRNSFERFVAKGPPR